MRVDLSLLVQLVVPVFLAAIAWGANAERNSAQDKDISSLERALELERAERLSYQAQQAQARMAWLLQRSGHRLDQTLTDVVQAGVGHGR